MHKAIALASLLCLAVTTTPLQAQQQSSSSSDAETTANARSADIPFRSYYGTMNREADGVRFVGRTGDGAPFVGSTAGNAPDTLSARDLSHFVLPDQPSSGRSRENEAPKDNQLSSARPADVQP